MPRKMLQVIPQSITYTPAGGTAITYSDFADAVTFSYEVSYGDINSQSADYTIGKLLTGRKASLKAVLNNFDLQQFGGATTGKAASYTSATDTLTDAARNFGINQGGVVFVGLDTTTGKTVTITITLAVAMVAGELAFGKDSEVKAAIQFDALIPATGPVWSIAYQTA